MSFEDATFELGCRVNLTKTPTTLSREAEKAGLRVPTRQVRTSCGAKCSAFAAQPSGLSLDDTGGMLAREHF